MKTNTNYTKGVFLGWRVMLLLLLFIGGLNSISLAQPNVSSYTFSQSTTTYTSVSGGTQIGSGNQDDTNEGTVNIGFNFNYHGVNFTTIGVQDNGFATLGATTGGSGYSGTDGIALNSFANSLAIMNGDLYGFVGTHVLRYSTTGSVGSRVFTLEWFNWGMYNSTSTVNEINFQIKLYEGTNVIQYIYQPTVPTLGRLVQVGLTGAAISDFNDRTSTTGWSSTTAGGTNAVRVTYSASIFPSNGLTFTWTPPAPCSFPANQPSSLVLTPLSGSSSQINGSFTAAAGSPSGYLVVRYLTGSVTTAPLAGVNYSAGNVLGLGTVVFSGAGTSFSSTGLLPNTTYDYYIYSFNSGGSCTTNYNTTSPSTASATTNASVNFTSTALGGLWSSAATWVGGVVPPSTDNAIIADGAIVTVDQVVSINNLTIGQGSSGRLQWNATANGMTVLGNILINSGATFLPYTTAATGVTLNVGGNFTNNGFANLAVPSLLLNFNGSQQVGGSMAQTIGGSGTFLGTGSSGIIRSLFFQTLGSSTIATSQSLITSNFAHTGGSLNTGGLLTIDNTADIYGQSINTQIANVAVTNMGTGYTAAPIPSCSGAALWISGATLAIGNIRTTASNIYLCTTAGTSGTSAPTHTSGVAGATGGTAVFLWLAPAGTIGTPYISTALTVGTQYFYGGNLYTAVLTTAQGTTPPTHTSGTVGSFRYAGTPAKLSSNWDAGTSTLRSLNIVSAGSGYSSSTSPAITIIANAAGSSAAATAPVLYNIIGPANSLTQKSGGAAIIAGGLTINSDQGANGSGNNQASSGVGSISTTAGGVNYTVAPQMAFGGPLALNLITNAGSGYTSNPTVTVSGGTIIAGSAYTSSSFLITVNQGTVESVYLNSSTAIYSVPPTLAITGGGGSGATLAFPSGCWPSATANVGGNGQLLSFTVTNAGYGYAAAPTIAFGPTSGTAQGGTFTTAATTPTCRLGLYSLTLNFFTPSASAIANSDDVAIPSNRKMLSLTLAGNGNGLNLSNNLILFGTSPLSLAASLSSPGNIINLNGSNLLFTWNGYAGASGTQGASNTFVKNGSITLTGRGGAGTFTFPFSGNGAASLVWFVGNTPTTATTGCNALKYTVTETGAPSGGFAGNAPIGTRAFRLQFNSGAVAGTSPTVNMKWNPLDVLTGTDNSHLFIGQSTSLSGPTWTVRSTAGAPGALAASGAFTTATVAPGPYVSTGDDYFAWINSLVAPVITSVSTPTCSNNITINGTGFDGVVASGITIGGTPVTSIVSNSGTVLVVTAPGGTSGVVSVSNAAGTSVSGSSISVAIPPTVSITGGGVSFCGASSVTPVNMTASSPSDPNITYTWQQSNPGTLNTLSGSSVTATITATTTYTVTATDNASGCSSTAITQVTIFAFPAFTAISTPPVICTGGSSVLSSGVVNGNFSVASIPYAPIAVPGTATVLTSGGNATTALSVGTLDDGGWFNLPIGFSFNFFGVLNNVMHVSTNGNVQFGATPSSTFSTNFTPGSVPNAAAPNNFIGGAWQDLYMTGPASTTGIIRYFTTGLTGNRICVVDFTNCGIYNSALTPVFFMSGQILMYETTGVVEVHLQQSNGLSSLSGSQGKTIGVENISGTVGAAAPGRNGTAWVTTVPEAWRFQPPVVYTFVWSPSGSLSSATAATPTATPSVTTTYSVQITDPVSGCVKGDTVTVPVLSIPSNPTTAGDTHCGPGVVNLTASGSPTLNWYDAPTGGVLVNTGTTFSPSLTATTTYYVESFNGGCSNPGGRVPVTGTIIAAPLLGSVTASPSAILSGGSSTLTATASQPASVSLYTFSQSTTTFSSIDGASGSVLVNATGLTDDTNFGTFPLGFNFNYHGTVFTTFGIQANGWIQLGSTTLSSYAPLGVYPNVIGGFTGDLEGNDANTPSAHLLYRVTGTAGNHILTVEWANWGFYSTATNEFNFQIKLFEASGAIEMIYGPNFGLATSTNTAGLMQVGLTGATITDFNNRTTSTDWSSTTAGGSNTATLDYNASVRPANGLIFTFSPPASGLTYAWSPSLNLNTTSGPTVISSGLTTDQVYCVTVTNGGGCSVSGCDTVTISSMVYNNTTITQVTSPSCTVPGALKVPVLRIAVQVDGLAGTVNMDGFQVDLGGTGNPLWVSNARIYYTGNSPVFVPDSVYSVDLSTGASHGYGSFFMAPIATGGNFPIGNIGGNATTTHYFWLAYDVYSGASSCGGAIDGQISMVIADFDNIEDDVSGQMPVAGSTSISIADNFTPSGSSISTCAGTTLTWSRACGYTGNYDVYLNGSPIAGYQNINGTYAVTPSLTPSTTYTWQVLNAGSTYIAGCNAQTFQTSAIVAPAASIGPISGPLTGTCGNTYTYSTPSFNDAIQWQVSTDNVTFFDLPGFTTGTAIIPANQGPGTFYIRAYAVANGVCSSDTVFSNRLTVVISAPTCSISPAIAGVVCPGASNTLTANGPAPYSWSTGETTQSIVVTPSATSSYTVTVGAVAAAPTYCAATNQGGSVITNVVLNTMNSNPPAPIGPSFYHANAPSGSNTTTLVAGSTYAFTLTLNGTGITSVWIDYNQDGVYSASEWVQPYTSAVTGTVNITVPAGALNGQTGMRVRSRLNGNINGAGDACLAMGSGSTEDYVITIVGGVIVPGNCNCTSVYTLQVGGPLASPTVSPDVAQCQGTPRTLDVGPVTGILAGPLTYLWMPGGATTSSAVVNPATSTTYTVTISDGACPHSYTVFVPVYDLPTVTITNNGPVCSGGTATVIAVGNTNAPPVSAGTDYVVSSIPFAPQTTAGTALTLADDGISGALPLGFTFSFYGVNYTQVYVGSNGFITFNAASGSGCCTGGTIPSATITNFIAFDWEDLYPPSGGTITYNTIGSPGSRIFIVSYDNIEHYPLGSGNNVTAQILLYEGTNVVEIHNTQVNTDADGVGETSGVENAAGTTGTAIGGRDGNATWSSTNEGFRFVLPAAILVNYVWTPGGSTNDTTAYVVTSASTYSVTVTDSRGCTGTGSTTVNVVLPTISCPADITVCNSTGFCSYSGSIGSATAGAQPCTNTITHTPLAPYGLGDNLITWTVTDQFGNTASCVQKVTVNDCQAPVITCPANTVVSCNGGDTSVGANGTATAADNCGGSVTITSSDVIVAGSCTANYDIQRTWSASDALGNTSTCVQTIHVRDLVAPVIGGLCFNQTLECPDVPVLCAAYASDDCSTFTLSFADVTTPTCGNSYVITRTYTATDACGNVSTAVETATVEDITAPVIDNVGPLQVVMCPATPTFSTPTASDECSTAALTYYDETITFCTGSYAVTRHYTATDPCGNSSTADEMIIVLDFSAPTISGVGSDMTIECPASPAWSNPTSADGCSNSTLTFDDVTTGGCGGSYSTTRTWTATDDCFNSSSLSQTISVEDHTAPTILNVNANSTIECPASPNFGVAVATDACSNFSLTSNDVTTAGCGSSYSTTRTWTATDDCGNTSTASETISVEDHTGPVISGVGADQAIECPQAPVFSAPAAADACGSSTMTFADATTNGCGGSYTTTRTWTAVDGCGNTTTAQQTIHVEDHTGPVISGVGANQVIECPATPVFSNPTQSDACSSSSMAFATVTTNGCGTTYTKVRTWTATDACGNVTTASQTISVQDHTNPVISGVNPGQTIQCPATPNFCSPTASDVCNSVVLTYADVNVAHCGGTYTRTRTWTAIDACGNTTTASQAINVIDNVAPVITGISPAVLIIQCPATPVFGTGIAADACSSTGMTLTFNDVTTALCGGAYTKTRTWTATDGCGNVRTGSQTVNVIDNTAPVITGVAANATIACPSSPTWSTPTSTDACGTSAITYADVTTTICGGSYSRTRTWTATDACGNHSSASRTVTVSDLTPPVISGVGANQTIQCPATPVYSNPIATDACGSATIAFNDVTATICGSSYSRTRTWTATDACGNHSTASQTITVQDITAPVLSNLGSNATIQCPASPVWNTPIATDACGSSTVTFSDVTVNGCGSSYTRTRTWTATDGCGNASTASRTITVQDNTAPVISGVGAAATINCPATPSFSTATAADACGTSTLTSNDVTVNGTCPGNYTTTRTWTATDGCGNTSTASQAITVHDVTPPTISCPATIYLCASALSPALTNATGSDGCSSVAISHSVCPANFPTGTTVITWTATDLCGNTATCTQNVIRDAAITVSIAHSGDISGYCQGNNAATLTANAAGGTGTLSYLWSNGATTQSISVSSTGTYTVVVTDQFAAPCSGTASYVFQTNSTSALSSYTILAKDNVHLHGYNTVQNGGVGAATTTGSAEGGGAGWVKIHDHSTLNATTTFARAAGIQVDGTSMVMNQVLSASNAAMPAFDAGLPASNTNVTVPAFTTVTLNGTVYGDITVGQGATLIFGHATVDLKNLYVGQGATVQFTQSCTKLRMASQLDIDRNAVFNPDADGKDVAVYLKHINNSGSGAGSANYSFGYGSGGGALTSVNVEYGASVKAFIYAPDGKIDVHGGASGLSATNGNTSSAFSSSSTTTMKGLFIARAVKAHGRTNWNWNTVCSSCNYSLRNSEDDAAQTLRSEELNSGMLIENFPDPFMDKTSIRFVMEKDTHATVKVYDISGKYISTIFEGDVRAKKEYRMEFDGSSLASGMYIYKVITPEDVHTGKMMLIKE